LQNYSQIVPVAQTEKGVTYAEKISSHEGVLDWKRPAQDLEQQIRAFTHWPGSWFFKKGKQVKVLKAKVVDRPGVPRVVSDGRLFVIGCGATVSSLWRWPLRGRKLWTLLPSSTATLPRKGKF